MLLIFVGVFYLHSRNYTIPEQTPIIENTTGLVQAHNRSLYDADGNLQYPEFTEEEFRIIKEDLGLNTIRFPVYYLNLLNEDLTWKKKRQNIISPPAPTMST